MTKAFENLLNVLKTKQEDSFLRTLYLGFWAGLYVSIGGSLYALVTSFNGNVFLLKAVGALLFCIGLILIVFLKAQLFTGNNLMLAPLLTRKAKLLTVLRNWSLVYVGNFIGSIIFVTLMYWIFGQFDFITSHLENIAIIKTGLSFTTAFGKAILCNMLVCLAVWFAVTGSSVVKKVIGIIIPVSAFVFLGFEHSVANMFLIPLGLIYLKVPAIEGLSSFLGNLVPVTLGNIVGGLIISVALILATKLKQD